MVSPCAEPPLGGVITPKSRHEAAKRKRKRNHFLRNILDPCVFPNGCRLCHCAAPDNANSSPLLGLYLGEVRGSHLPFLNSRCTKNLQVLYSHRRRSFRWNPEFHCWILKRGAIMLSQFGRTPSSPRPPCALRKVGHHRAAPPPAQTSRTIIWNLSPPRMKCTECCAISPMSRYHERDKVIGPKMVLCGYTAARALSEGRIALDVPGQKARYGERMTTPSQGRKLPCFGAQLERCATPVAFVADRAVLAFVPRASRHRQTRGRRVRPIRAARTEDKDHQRVERR